MAEAARRRLQALSSELGERRGQPSGEADGPPEVGPAVRAAPRGPRGGQKPPGPGELVGPGSGGRPEAHPDPEEHSREEDAWACDPGADGEPGETFFLERPEPVYAGLPAALLAQDALIHTPVGRALPPEPARVPAPGRHAVDRAGSAVGEWVDDRLPATVRSRLSFSGQHLVVLSGVLGIALALAGWLALRGGSEQEAVPQTKFVAQQTHASAVTGAAPSMAAATGSASGSAPDGAAGAAVVVDVVGKVRRPGIVTLPAGSRVNDAVVKAGGLRAGARTDAINLARVLVDGEQIVVGQPARAVAAPDAAASTTSGAAASGALVNINTAGLSELDELPGVGPVTAQKILDYRTAHGAFTSVDGLLEVDGIGDKTLADIAPRATL